MKGKTVRVKLSSVKRQPIRQDHGSEEDLKALARSWLARAIHPIVCRSDMTAADGHRRLKGLELLGETDVDVFVTDEVLTDANLIEMGLESDIHRASVSFFDKCQAVKKWEEMNPSVPAGELAKKLNVSPGQISRWKSLFKCVPAVIESARTGAIDSSSVYAISQLPPDQQPGLLALRLSGDMTRDQFVAATKGASSPPEKPVPAKASRIPIPLPKIKASLVITSDTATIDGVIAVLTEALETVRKTNRDNVTLATAKRIWAEKGKAPA